jgi:hypothetical protein
MFSIWTDPTLVPGDGQYEKFDPKWIRSLTARRENVFKRIFPAGGVVIDIPDTVKLAMAGDWGTNTAPAVASIRDLMIAEAADYTVHLGDVYYSGTPDEEAAFAAMWPAGSKGSLALNSNHEMYSGGTGYLQTLADPKFAIQGGQSYFALRNKNWLIVGLDTARYSDDYLYKNGRIDGRQSVWLRALFQQRGDRKLILLSHHDGFNLRAVDAECQHPRPHGIIYKPLWADVNRIVGWPAQVFRWYWGHVHAPMVFSNGYRCIGHGGIPYLPFPDYFRDFGEGHVRVLFAETAAARTGNRLRAPNGFACVWLDGPEFREQLIDENGRAVWQGAA